MYFKILLSPRWQVLLLSLSLSACASMPSDWGRADVAQMTAERGRELPKTSEAQAFTERILRAPLTAEAAVQLALLNNPAVRLETARLGFAAAEVYDAGRLANPVFSASRLTSDDASTPGAQVNLGIAVNFVNLLLMPANTRFAEAQFEAAKQDVAAATLDLAARVEAAWFAAVGAEQLAQMREAAAQAQAASANLSQRFFEAGNITRRAQAMEQAAASQARLDALSARAEAVATRSALNRLMGLDAGQSSWTLDARLAEPLADDDSPDALQRLSLDSRLDLASLRSRARAIADRYGVARRTRLIGAVELGAEREREFDGSVNTGPTLALELPLFNWGGGRTAAIKAALDETEAELDARVLDVSNAVHHGAAQVAAAKARAEQYRSVLVPQREVIVAEAQKEQNFMLIGIFELILAQQQTYDAYAGYIEAVRDYWTARADLARVVGRRLPSSAQAAEPTLDPADLLHPDDPAPATHDHGGHH